MIICQTQNCNQSQLRHIFVFASFKQLSGIIYLFLHIVYYKKSEKEEVAGKLSESEERHRFFIDNSGVQGAFSPYVVIFDMIMPEINGRETFTALREICPRATYLLSSGCSLEGYASAILKESCNGFLRKPFTIGQLSTEIRRVLGSSNPKKSVPMSGSFYL